MTLLRNFVQLGLISALMIATASDVYAQSRRRGTYTDSTTTNSSPSYYSGGGNTGRMAVSGGLGFYGAHGAQYVEGNNNDGPKLSGLFGLGGDFEYFLAEDMSVGGIFRYYSTSDSFSGAEFTDTFMTLGGIVRAHLFETTSWTGGLTTGLGMLTGSSKSGSTTVNSGTAFGFYFGLHALYKINPNLAVGVENLRMIALGDKANGWPLSDYFAKARFMF